MMDSDLEDLDPGFFPRLLVPGDYIACGLLRDDVTLVSFGMFFCRIHAKYIQSIV